MRCCQIETLRGCASTYSHRCGKIKTENVSFLCPQNRYWFGHECPQFWHFLTKPKTPWWITTKRMVEQGKGVMGGWEKWGVVVLEKIYSEMVHKDPESTRTLQEKWTRLSTQKRKTAPKRYIPRVSPIFWDHNFVWFQVRGRSDIMDMLFNTVSQELLVAKTFYFFFFSAFGSLFPLMAVYFKQLGMSPGQCGILVGVRPLIEFVAVPFWVNMAEK